MDGVPETVAQLRKQHAFVAVEDHSMNLAGESGGWARMDMASMPIW